MENDSGFVTEGEMTSELAKKNELISYFTKSATGINADLTEDPQVFGEEFAMSKGLYVITYRVYMNRSTLNANSTFRNYLRSPARGFFAYTNYSVPVNTEMYAWYYFTSMFTIPSAQTLQLAMSCIGATNANLLQIYADIAKLRSL